MMVAVSWSQTAKVKKLKLAKFGESVFGPFYFQDSLYYAWDRPVSKSKDTKNEEGRRFFDLFSVGVNNVKVLSAPSPLPFGVNSVQNDGPLCFSRNGKWMFYTRNLHAFDDSVNVDDHEFKLGIFYREINGGKLGEEIAFPFNSDSANIAHPAVNEDGSLIVFSSDKPGGEGGADLYYSEKTGNKWSEPKSLGNTVNSSSSESFPALYNGVLYFSSGRNEETQGLDIFKVPFSKSITLEPIPLEAPINSEKDDFGITFINGDKGYFATNRSKNQDNIFFFELVLPKADSVYNQNLKFCYEFFDENLKDEKGLSFKWHFGDGGEGNEKEQKYCYKNIGEYVLIMDVTEEGTGYFYESVAIDTIKIYNIEFPTIDFDMKSLHVEINNKFNSKKYTNFYWVIDGDKYFSTELDLKEQPNEINFVCWGGDYMSKVYEVKLITKKR